MSDRTPEEQDLLENLGEGEGEPASDPEGGGGARREESFVRQPEESPSHVSPKESERKSE